VEDIMSRVSYRAVQDECAPDALEYFEKSLVHITGYSLSEFKKAAKYTESHDGLHIEWQLDYWILEYDGDDPYHKLRKVAMSQIEACSLRECALALETGKPVFAHWFEGRNLVSVEAYVKLICSDHFCDTNGEEHRFDVGWSDTEEASLEAFKQDILSVLDS
jgi:hypothetical protein